MTNATIVLILLTATWLVAAPEGPSSAQAAEMRLRVEATSADLTDVPVHARVALPEALGAVDPRKLRVSLHRESAESAEKLPGQIVRTARDQPQLWWILPKAKAGVASEWLAQIERAEESVPADTGFAFADTPGAHLDLLLGGRRLTRYMYARDVSTEERNHETYKPYHHVFAAAGEQTLTKGPGGLYTHHRGLFIGGTLITHEGKRHDLWGMGGGTAQVHREFVERTTGPVLARSISLIDWLDGAGVPLVAERREVTVFRQPASTLLLLELRSTLRPTSGPLTLGGDPEHGGFQYRPHNEVAERAAKKDGSAAEADLSRYLFHRDDVDPKKDRDLPWAALACTVHGKRYTVQHMNHPDNPRPTIYSAYRPYGRFGAFFKREIKEDEALTVRYRIWVAERELLSVEEMDARQAAFARAPKVTLVE